MEPLILINNHNTDRSLQVLPIDKEGEIGLQLPEDVIFLDREQAFQLASYIVKQLELQPQAS